MFSSACRYLILSRLSAGYLVTFTVLLVVTATGRLSIYSIHSVWQTMTDSTRQRVINVLKALCPVHCRSNEFLNLGYCFVLHILISMRLHSD